MFEGRFYSYRAKLEIFVNGQWPVQIGFLHANFSKAVLLYFKLEM